MIDMYGKDVARASELIRKHAHTDYYHYFAINMEASLEAFIAMMDSCREEGRQESAKKIAGLEAQVAELLGKANLYEAIQRAAAELPEEFNIVLDIELHAGTVSLILPTGQDLDIDGEDLTDSFNNAIGQAKEFAERIFIAAPSTVEG